jgi:hypothetical protein
VLFSTVSSSSLCAGAEAPRRVVSSGASIRLTVGDVSRVHGYRGFTWDQGRGLGDEALLEERPDDFTAGVVS